MGSFSHTVDGKGRVFIPSKWRDELGATVVITGDFLLEENFGCLIGMSVIEWQKQVEKMANVPRTDRAAYAEIRKTIASASECEVDKQGRILLPTTLRAFFKISDMATLNGVIDRFEIWPPNCWEEYKQAPISDVNETMEALGRYGL
ncbi:MAG: division/cell wall cluster transcriptional repressor MraZ [Clostridia bacterium]